MEYQYGVHQEIGEHWILSLVKVSPYMNYGILLDYLEAHPNTNKIELVCLPFDLLIASAN
jgi:hypothetical protein